MVHGLACSAAYVCFLVLVFVIRKVEPNVRISNPVTLASLMALTAILIGIMKQRTPWQILSSFGSTFIYNVVAIIYFNKNPAPPKWMNQIAQASVVGFIFTLPVYLITMVF